MLTDDQYLNEFLKISILIGIALKGVKLPLDEGAPAFEPMVPVSRS